MKAQLDQFLAKGWVKIEGFLSSQDVAISKKRILEYIKIKRAEYAGRDINFVDSGQLSSFHKLGDFRWANEFQNSALIKNLVTPFLCGESPEARGMELFAKPAGVGLPSPDHQDNYYWCVDDANALTVWIALDPANQGNGAVHYYEGSHLGGLIEHEPSYAKGSSQKIKNADILEKYNLAIPSLNPGDVLVHHCLTVHGSGPNLSNQSRLGWTMQFKSSSSEYNLEMKYKYEKDLADQIAGRSNNLKSNT
ncbi:Phytanoyl-CoA dioxygenase [Burkholderiaceae bacterium]